MRNSRICAFAIIIIVLASQFYPVAASNHQDPMEEASYISMETVAALSMVSQLKVQTQPNNGLNIIELINASTNKTDTDGDRLPDSVEAVLGTDFNNTDSDFDRLDDYNETVIYDSDPLEPDSNHDGLADYFEVMNVQSLDIDGDGYPNVWDFDNDGDGVEDNIDSSPFAHSSSYDTFNFNVKTNGNPTYIDFQLRPQNPDNVRLALQEWDWPYDNKGTMQDLDNSTDDVQVIPMLELTMSSVPDQAEVTDYGIGIFSNTAYVPLVQVQGLGANVALAGKMFYPESAPLDLQVNASLIWLVMAKTDSMENGTVISENTTLIKYQENFTLTGFSIEESYGSDVGLFYSDSINQTIATNLVMAYSFLRNNQSTLYDMPAEFTDNNVSVTSKIESFSHRDLALLNITTRMTPDALNSLPVDRVLPVIAASENNFTKKELSELDSSSYIVGNNLTVNLRTEPIITLKTLKTNWYNTTNQEPLEIKDILSELKNWGQAMGLDDDTISSMMILAIAWNVGESTVPKIGDESTDFNVVETIKVVDLVNTIVGSTFFSISALSEIIGIVTQGVYRVFFSLNYIGEVFQGALAIVFSSSKALDKVVSVFGTIAKFANGLGKVLTVIAAITMVIGFVFDIGFAIWGFFKIAMSEGWSSTGTFQGAVYATIMGVYAISLLVIGIILLAVAFIPVVGWIIALVGGIIMGVIALTDFILGFFGIGISNLVEKLVSTFHQTYRNTEFSLDVINSSIDINDYNKNGFDVGDRITFSSFINGTVLRTSAGTWEDVKESYVIPHYNVKRWMTEDTPYAYWVSPYGSFTNNVSYSEINPDSKNTTYEIGAWIEPKWGTINFPLAILFEADYKIIYTDRRIEWDFWNGYKYTRLNQTGTTQNELDTLYFDVLPENINDFANWYPLSSLDRDHDGLANNIDPYPWSWDSDSDGLSDIFELDIIGSDPGNADKDGDGLNDRMELIYGTNLTEWDSDGDNLSDYKEINGWDINFNYSGQSFNMTVHSDPLMQDTDGDGVDDQMEYWSFLNPRSRDSDGDGVDDEPNPKVMTYVNFETKWGTEGTGDGQFDHPKSVAVDDDGYVYVADSGNKRIQKFDSNGNFITKWGSNGTGDGQFIDLNDVAVDTNGNIYVAENHWSSVSPNDMRIQKFDSNGVFITSWWSNSSVMAVDAEGYVYSPARTNFCIDKFYPNGTLIKTSWCGGALGMEVGITALAVDADGNVYVTDGFDLWNTGIFKFDSNGTFIKRWGSEGYLDKNFTNDRGSGWPEGLAVDEKGFVYIADTFNNHIQKFDSGGWFVTRWGQYGTEDGFFINPTGIAVDKQENVYISEGFWTSGNRIQKFSQITDIPPRNVSDTIDTDGDGLTDMNETRGWNVTFTNVSGTFSLHVTSEFLANDTDFDVLSDLDEYNYSSNPRDVDTDDDGLNDYVEMILGTNITHYDTDGEGLDDGTEISFGSDPTKVDTDDDGLTDLEEFNYSSDPKKKDTDGDGLKDKDEKDFKSNPRDPDSDGDLMFDGTEKNKSTDPWNPDSDGDGLPDGYELLYNTSATNNDTDKDGVPDGEEIDNRMDPLNNDTDGDGLNDYQELEKGTNPLSGDTKGNGLNDSEDPYSFAPNVDRIWVAYDPDDDTEQLIENLKKYTNVTIFQPDEIQNYSSKPNILLVGRPGLENNTAGNIIYSILNASSPDTLARMLESDYDRFYVDYDIWNTSQTVVMLSHPYPSDHYKVLDLFKTLNQTIEYPNIVSDFKADAIQEMGSFIMVELKNPVKPSIELIPYNETNIPHKFTYGLYGNEIGVKYLDINVSENVMNETVNNVKRALIVIYYTAADLDRTGDGDADGPGDIDEKTLGINWFNDSANKWEKLSTDMDWVNNIGINTTNDVIYGREYEGYVWANVSHLSVYGLSGSEIEPQPDKLTTTEDGVRIIPMFEAVPELTFFKQISLLAGVEQNISVSNVSGIYEITLNHPENANLMLYLSKVKSLPAAVPEAPGTVYSYFEMLFTKLKTNIKVNPETQIDFKVPKDWAGSKEGITLMHYENGWNPIPIEVTGEDEVNYYCTAEIDSFSIFAIVYSTPGDIPASEQITQTTQETTVPTSTSLPPTGKQPAWFELIMSILVVLVILGAAYYILNRKRV